MLQKVCDANDPRIMSGATHHMDATHKVCRDKLPILAHGVSTYHTHHLTGVTLASNEREDDYADSKKSIRLAVKELFGHDTVVNKAVSDNDDAIQNAYINDEKKARADSQVAFTIGQDFDIINCWPHFMRKFSDNLRGKVSEASLTRMQRDLTAIHSNTIRSVHPVLIRLFLKKHSKGAAKKALDAMIPEYFVGEKGKWNWALCFADPGGNTNNQGLEGIILQIKQKAFGMKTHSTPRSLALLRDRLRNYSLKMDSVKHPEKALQVSVVSIFKSPSSCMYTVVGEFACIDIDAPFYLCLPFQFCKGLHGNILSPSIFKGGKLKDEGWMDVVESVPRGRSFAFPGGL
jgi:hypothetical protein